MQLSEVKVGMQVVVNTLLDTPIYRVEGLDGYEARLSYMRGTNKVRGGSIDVSVLKKPTKAQLKAHGIV